MTDLSTLDPDTRAYALVGKFLSYWATMEYMIRSAIGKAFELDSIKAAVLTSNIQLRDKIHILRTLVGLSLSMTSDERERYDKVLIEIANYSWVRNMMAHDGFSPSDDGKAVEFMVVRAKGELKFPEESWDIPKFEAAYTKILSFTISLRQMNAKIAPDPLTSALAAQYHPASNLGFLGPGTGGLLNHLLQEKPDSGADPASEGK